MRDPDYSVLEDASYTKYPKRAVYSKCMRLILRFRYLSALLFLFGVLGGLARVFVMYALAGLGSGGEEPVAQIEIVSAVGGLFFGGVLIYWSGYQVAVRSQDIIREVQSYLIHAAAKELCISDDEKRSLNGGRIDLMLLLRQDVRAIRTIILNLIRLVTNYIYGAALFGMLIYVNWKLTLVMPLLIAPIFLVIIRINAKIVLESIGIRDHIVKNAGTTSFFIRALPRLKMFDNKELGANILKDMMFERFQLRRRLAELKALNVFMFGAAGTVGLTAVVWFIFQSTDANQSLGGYIAVFIGFLMLQQVVSVVLATMGKNNEMLPVARHFFYRMDEWADEVERAKHIQYMPLGTVQSAQLKDYWVPGDEQQRTGWDVILTAGKIYGVIANRRPAFERLASAFCDPALSQRGQLFINDLPVSDIDPTDLSRSVDMFTEESTVYPMTVRDNIKLVSKTITEEEFEKVAEVLKLSQAFQGLSDGIDTRITVSTVDLVAKHIALITLARLMLTSASIIFVDMKLLCEVPKSLVLQAIDYLTQTRKTSIIILKPTTVSDIEYCDRVLFFKRNDLLFDASRTDLDKGEEQDYFYINPVHDVCSAVKQIPDSRRWPTFERAELAYRGVITRANEEFDGVLTYLGSIKEEKKSDLHVDLEHDMHFEEL